MEFKYISLIILVVVFIYEIAWRPYKCNRKIGEYVKNKGGSIASIERLTHREEIYSVSYRIDDTLANETVKFSLFYDESWY